jgi:succinate-semialdehyde dehydrogenase/glutarate-semialdehyde dehydrogenase
MIISQNPYSNTIEFTGTYDAIASIQNTLDRSKLAYSNWKNLSISNRKAHLFKLAETMNEEKSRLAKQITAEMGKPLNESIAEIEKCIASTHWYIENIDRLITDTSFLIDESSTHAFVRLEPIGSVLGIMPWNFPYWQVFRYAIPTLLMGNAVILKHAPNVQGCAKALEQLFQSASLPEDIFISVFPSNEDIEILIASPVVKAVTFTGSERTGRIVAGMAGKYLKKCVMELGGSDPFIVLPDTDLNNTIKEAVKARLQNNGQSCIAAKRFIIHTECYEAFINGLKNAVSKLKLGDPMLDTTDLGPMARRDLKEQLVKQVEQSITLGATCTYKHPFHDSDSNFFAPVILENISPDAPARHEELFGPVFTCIKAENDAEAITIANETSFGLGASVWTKDIKRGQDLASKIESGSVFINGITRSDARIPFGGIKNSGFGRELSVYGLHEFVNIKTYWEHTV